MSPPYFTTKTEWESLFSAHILDFTKFDLKYSFSGNYQHDYIQIRYFDDLWT